MDKALKQRLVGAIVLIALAVIVLPMIFGGRPSPGGPGPTEIEIPSAPPDLEFEKRRFPVGDQELPTPSDTQEPAPDRNRVVSPAPAEVAVPVPDEPAPDMVQQEPVEQELPTVVELPQESPSEVVNESSTPVDPSASAELSTPTEQVDEVTPAPVAADNNSTGSLRYVVQVASFGNADNAARLAGQLEESGYDVLLDQVSSETARLNRVRVGPYSSESEAQEAARALRNSIDGINPRIVDLEPDQASPVIASEDPLVRWVVQVGSFGSEENAENLVARLRLSGHSAYDETVSTDTSTIFRVRVGPFLDREEAIRVEQQIRSDMGISGVVMSAD